MIKTIKTKKEQNNPLSWTKFVQVNKKKKLSKKTNAPSGTYHKDKEIN
jgi:hypothetical protein